MTHRVQNHPSLILAVGTQVVALKSIMGQHGRRHCNPVTQSCVH